MLEPASGLVRIDAMYWASHRDRPPLIFSPELSPPALTGVLAHQDSCDFGPSVKNLDRAEFVAKCQAACERDDPPANVRWPELSLFSAIYLSEPPEATICPVKNIQ